LYPCDGLASHAEWSRNTPIHFIATETGISSSMIGYFACTYLTLPSFTLPTFSAKSLGYKKKILRGKDAPLLCENPSSVAVYNSKAEIVLLRFKVKVNNFFG